MARERISTTNTQRPRFWRTATLFAVAISFISLRYLSANPDVYFEEQRDTYIANQAVLLAHVAGASLALLLGAIQMLPSIRAHRLGVHRVLGRLYGVGVLVGSISGLLLSRTAFGGTVSTVGFTSLATLWLATLIPAITNARNGNIAAHRRWMIRNYALTYAAVTLRLWLLPLAAIPGLEFIDAYRTVSWLCWVPNLIAAELFLRRSSSHRSSTMTQSWVTA